MDLSQVTQHPMFQKIFSDIEAQNNLTKQQALEADFRAREARAQAGRTAQAAVDEALAAYEVSRDSTHQVLGELFKRVQEFSQLTGRPPGNFDEATFMTVNLPTLKPSNNWNTGFSTTQAAYHHYMATRGVWK